MKVTVNAGTTVTTVTAQAGALTVHNATDRHTIATSGGSVIGMTQADRDAIVGALGYETRGEAEAANVPAAVKTLRVGALAYRRDAAGTALTTEGGQNWSPLGDIYIEHFGATAFNAGIDNGPLIQTAVDWAASRNNGATVHARQGVYYMSTTVTWKPKVSFHWDREAIFRASAAMGALFAVPLGGRVRKVFWRGGQLDAAFLATRCLVVEDFEQTEITDVDLLNCDGHYLRLGAAGQTQGNYELNCRDCRIVRSGGVPFAAGADNIGIYSAGIFADSDFTTIPIVGVRTGMRGQFYNTNIRGVHPWSHVPTQGEMDTAFWIVGDNNAVTDCYADNWRTYGFRFNGNRNLLAHSRTNRGTDIGDNIGTAVYLDPGSTLNAHDNVLRSQSAANRIGADFGGDLTGLQASRNFHDNVNTVRSVYTTLAGAGTTQATALAAGRVLSGTVTRITSTATDTAVALPAAKGRGGLLVVTNTSGRDVTVFPQVGENILPLGNNVGVAMPTGTTLTFVADSDTRWVRI